MSFQRQEAGDRRELVEPELDEARLDQTWSAIEDRLDESPRRGRFVAGAVVALAAAVLLGVLWPREPAEWTGTTLATADEGATVRLPEGSVVQADPDTDLVRVREDGEEVRLTLRAGAASFDVVRNPDRLFAVEAGDVEVRVVGTAFEVARVGERVRVTVERGAVDVRRGDQIARLRAGDTWEDDATLPAPEVQSAENVAPTEAEVAEADDVDEDPPSRGRRAARVGPDELFGQAADARRSGDSREAARLYGRLVARFPRDARAALAAFELGRIRLDQLGDPAGAAQAFRRAIALGGGPFAQDARGRLVEAYDAAGQTAACQRAKAAYLGRYPSGRHVGDVTGACE